MTPRTTRVRHDFFEPTAGNRFHVDVQVIPPGHPGLIFYALVDTGADDLVLSDSLLPLFASVAPRLQRKVVHTASGSASWWELPKFRCLVDGISISTDIVFSPGLSSSAALCGRVPLLAATSEVGLRASEWLRAR